MHYIFVINGREDKRWIADEVDRQIRQLGSSLDYEIYTTSGAGDGTRFTRIYCDLHPNARVCFVACGGTGTLNEVASGLAGFKGKSLALLAFGTTNDFTKNFPDRDFVYHGSFNPFGEMSRDCTLHLDSAGDAYFVSASRDNADLHVYRLTEDYLNADEWVKSLYCHEFREAPALFERNGRTYMISSYCTGWAPNQGKWCAADSVTGRWGLLRDFGDSTTFRSQSAFVRRQGDRYWYVGDRWMGGEPKYFESTYVALEIQFDGEGNPFIEWTEEPELFNAASPS